MIEVIAENCMQISADSVVDCWWLNPNTTTLLQRHADKKNSTWIWIQPLSAIFFTNFVHFPKDDVLKTACQSSCNVVQYCPIPFFLCQILKASPNSAGNRACYSMCQQVQSLQISQICRNPYRISCNTVHCTTCIM